MLRFLSSLKNKNDYFNRRKNLTVIKIHFSPIIFSYFAFFINDKQFFIDDLLVLYGILLIKYREIIVREYSK